MFVNREKEKEELTKLLSSSRFELVVVYGRRRIGKSELLKEVLKQKDPKKTVYYQARTNNNYKYFKEQLGLEKYADDWNTIFENLPFDTIVIDEFPYLVDEHKDILSILQNAIDNNLNKTKKKIVLLGSSISMMKKYALSQSSPLYGRRTATIKLEQIEFEHLSKFFPKYKFDDLQKIYSFTGGIPYYINMVNNKLDKFLNNELNNSSSFFRDELKFLLREDFNELNTYYYILEAISKGFYTRGEINKFTAGSSDISPYLKNLEQIEIIRSSDPVLGKTSRSTRFELKDNFIRFWFNFIYPKLEMAESGLFSFDSKAKEYRKFLKYTFAQIAEQFVLSQLRNGKIKFSLTKFGSHWDATIARINGKYRRVNYDVDFILLDEKNRDIFVFEFVDSALNDKVKNKVIQNLQEKRLLIESEHEFVNWRFGVVFVDEGLKYKELKF